MGRPETSRRKHKAERAAEQDRCAEKCWTALLSLASALIRAGATPQLEALLSRQMNLLPPGAEKGALTERDQQRSPNVRRLRHLIKIVETGLAASGAVRNANPDAIRALGDDVRTQHPEAADGLSELVRGSEEDVEDTLTILRGSLDVVRAEQWLGNDAPELLYMLPLMGDRFKVVRDHHKVGWHYHYCKLNGERSDVVLTYQPQGTTADPLYWEHHAEGKAKFKARVDRWGFERRFSVYASCADDARKRKLADYRPPSSDAAILLLNP